VLVARATEQFDDLSTPRRLTMQSARFDLVAHARRAGYQPIRHLLTSRSI
jgi:hypothetical protein